MASDDKPAPLPLPVHFSVTGWSKTACGLTSAEAQLGTPHPEEVTCEACREVEFDASGDAREETDEEFRARIKEASARGDKGPFMRRLVEVTRE